MITTDAQKLIEAASAHLSEHFEAVQILATFPHSEGGTQIVLAGRGNWYARQGMARYFVEREQAVEFAHELNKEKDE